MKRLLLFLTVLFLNNIVFAQIAPIGGIKTVCQASTTTLTEASPGGTWISANPAVASINVATGVVTGVTAGTALITYSVLVYSTTTMVTVTPLPAAITGPSAICMGNTITLTDGTRGGNWTSVPSSVVAVGSNTGIVTGVSAGGALVTYTLPTGCKTTFGITVNPNPSPIVSGSPYVYTGSSTSETDATPGGAWSIGNAAIATINSAGTAKGVSTGMAVIFYTLSTGCYTSTKIRVNPLPDSGLVFPLEAWYPFCDDTIDHSGRGADLTAVSITATMPTPTFDRFGNPNNAYAFLAANKNMLYYSTVFTLPGDFTISAWTRPTIAQNSVIVYNGHIPLDGCGFVMNDGSPYPSGVGTKISVVFGNSPFSTTAFSYSIPPALLGSHWFNLVLIKSGTTFYFYVDNTLVGSGGIPYTPPTSNFALGIDQPSTVAGPPPTHAFTGDIDDIAVYNRMLLPYELNNLQNFNPDIFAFSLGNDTTICSDYMTLAPNPQYTTNDYLWFNGNTADSIITVKPSTATLGNKYYLNMSKYRGCSYTDTITVYNHPIPINLGNDTNICLGESIVLKGNAGNFPGSHFTWNNDSTTHSLVVNTTGVYYVVVDSSVCIGRDTIRVNTHAIPDPYLGPDVSHCQGQPDTLRPQYDPGFTYTWSDGSNLDTLVVNTSGRYWVSVNDTGCVRSDTINVHVVYDTMTFYFKDTALCKGGLVQPRLTTNVLATYQWRPTAGIPVATAPQPIITPDTSATYVLTVSSALCPDIVDSFHIDVQPYPVVFAGSKVRSVCQFDTIHMTAHVVPGWYTHYKYSWSPGTHLDDSLSSTIVYKGDSANLILTVTTPAGCTGKDSTEIIGHPGNYDSLFTSTLLTVCPYDSVQLVTGYDTIAAYVAVTTTQHWFPSTYLSDTSAQSPWVHPITNTDYTLVSTSQWGCRDTLHVTVKVVAGAVIDIPDSAVIYPGESFQISPQTNCTYFRWFPPVGLTDTTISNPIAQPTTNTRYFVRAVTEAGCRVTDSIFVNVVPETIIDIPNAFTPGSGVNNLYMPVKRGIAKLNFLKIYNRWGVKVFESNDIATGWDGKYNGKDQPFGVYVYEVDAVTSTGMFFHKKGNVTLLR